MREEGTGGRRKLHFEDLQNVCSSSNIIRMFNSREMGYLGM
jgi:hypothetical protein